MKIEEIKININNQDTDLKMFLYNQLELTQKLNELIKAHNEREEGIPDDGEPPCKNCGVKSPKDSKPLSHFFKPEYGQKYWVIDSTGIDDYEYNPNNLSQHLVSIGNCYRTREEAQLALDKQQALVRLWDWADTNAYFRPEWGNFEEDKYFPIYDYEEGTLEITFEFDRNIQSLLPYFKSEEDCEKFIKNNKEDLELILK